MGLIGIVVASVVNILARVDALALVISIIVMFAGPTAHDTQRIEEMDLASDTEEVAGNTAIHRCARALPRFY